MSHHEHHHHHHGHHHEHSHHHGHSHAHIHHHGSTENIKVAFWLNLGFAIFELLGGIFARSMAILSDAVHDFGDALSLGVAWYLQRVSEKGRDDKFTYGYRRFSLLGALFISLVLAVASSFIIVESIRKLQSPGEPREGLMLLMALVGFAVNGFAAFRLSKGESINERAVMLHLLEDVLGWLAVLVVSIVMHFVHLPILDPILSLCISVWVLINAGRNLLETFKIMLQEIPADVDVDALQKAIAEVEDVESFHDFHLWSLDGQNHILSIHVVISAKAACQPEQCALIKERIRTVCEEHHIEHVTVEIDVHPYSCGMESC